MPVLIAFHPKERDAADAVQIAVLDEALTLLILAVEDTGKYVITAFILIEE